MHNCNFYYTCNELDWFFPCWEKFHEGTGQCTQEEDKSVFYNSSNHTLLLEGSSFGDEEFVIQAFENFYLDLLSAKSARGLFCIYLKASDTKHVSLMIEFITRLADLQQAGCQVEILWLFASRADTSYCLGETMKEEFPEINMRVRHISEQRQRGKIQSTNVLQDFVKDPMFRINLRMALYPPANH